VVPSAVNTTWVALIAMLSSLESCYVVAIWASCMLDLYLATALQMLVLGLLEEVSASVIS
jgi:hypothetical protein